MTVLVAQQAIVSFNINNIQDKMMVKQGVEVVVACLLEKHGYPAPTISISLNKTTGLTNLGGGENTTVSYYPSLQDTGATLLCQWEQVGPGGEVLYIGEEVTAPLDVVLAPTILPSPAQYLYHDGTKLIIQFLAKPVPAHKDVKWFLIMKDNERRGIEKMEDLVVVMGDMEEIRNESHKFETSLYISNLTHNITLEITIRNMVGLDKKIITIIVPSPAATTQLPFLTKEQFQASYSTTTITMTTGSILGFLALLLFSIILVLVTIILVRFTRNINDHKVRASGEFHGGGGQRRGRVIIIKDFFRRIQEDSFASCGSIRPSYQLL